MLRHQNPHGPEFLHPMNHGPRRLLSLCTAAYLGTELYHALEMAELRCLLADIPAIGARCLPGAGRTLPPWRQLLYGTALVACAVLPCARGAPRRTAAMLVLVAWVTLAAELSFAPPHLEYVSLTLLYVTIAREVEERRPTSAAVDAALLAVLRAALAVGYGWSGVAKLARTPLWRHGRVFAAIVASEALRDGTPSWLVAALAQPRLGASLAYAAACTECALPWLEVATALTGRDGFSDAGGLASAALQLGILCLMPLTAVSLGMLLFHVALLDARIAMRRHAREWVAGDAPACAACPLRRLAWRLSAAVGLGILFSARPAHCFVRPEHASRVRGEASSVVDALFKGLLPLPATSWEDWPCKPLAPWLSEAAERGGESGSGEGGGGQGGGESSEGGDAGSDHINRTVTAAVAERIAARRTARRLAFFGDAHGAVHIRQARALFFGRSAYAVAGGGHLWHVAVSVAVDAAHTPDGSGCGLASLLCACSPHSTHRLARRLRHHMSLDGPPIAWFHIGEGARFDCWRQFCKSGAGSAVASACGAAESVAREGGAAAAAPDLHGQQGDPMPTADAGSDILRAAAGDRSFDGASGSHGVESIAAPNEPREAPTPASAHRQRPTVAAAATLPQMACLQHCIHPCHELSGGDRALLSECGDCEAARFHCRPTMNGFPDALLAAWHGEAASASSSARAREADTPGGTLSNEGGPTVGAVCEDAAFSWLCMRLAQRGACSAAAHARAMHEACRQSCGLCANEAPGRHDGESESGEESCSEGGGGQASCEEGGGVCELSGGGSGSDSGESGGGSDTGATAPMRSQEQWCGAPSDESQLPTRGYVVLRGAVPADELRAMQRYVSSLGLPRRRLCGVPYSQQPECTHSEEHLWVRYPQTMQRLQATMRRWEGSGLARRARLGWPLEAVAAEYIAVNRWSFAHNASCTLAAVFDAAAEYARPCLQSCPVAEAADSLSECWQLCMYDAVVHRVPRSQLHATLAALEARADACAPPRYALRYALLDGPIDYVLGPSGAFHTGGSRPSARCDEDEEESSDGIGSEAPPPPPAAAGADGHTSIFSNAAGHAHAGTCRPLRLLSHLRAYLTELYNASFYLGYHDWHVDGDAARHGREHKAYVLVSKGDLSVDGEAASDDARDGADKYSNLRLAPSHAQSWPFGREDEPHWRAPAVHGCAADFCRTPLPAALASESERRGWRQAETAKGRGWFRGMADDALSRRKLVAWGVPSGRRAVERVGCDVPLAPGDVLFWREDAWHRTQDMRFDRVALRIDIVRFPFATDVAGYGS